MTAADAALERARETLTGDHGDPTMACLIGGGAAVAGLGPLLVRSRR